jgi:hypothetical protein
LYDFGAKNRCCSHLSSNSLLKPTGKLFRGTGNFNPITGNFIRKSTGTNFLALSRLASEMHRAGETGSLVTLICDSGERYRQTYYEPQWLAVHGLDPAPYEAELYLFLETAQPLGFTVEDASNPHSLRGSV